MNAKILERIEEVRRTHNYNDWEGLDLLAVKESSVLNAIKCFTEAQDIDFEFNTWMLSSDENGLIAIEWWSTNGAWLAFYFREDEMIEALKVKKPFSYSDEDDVIFHISDIEQMKKLWAWLANEERYLMSLENERELDTIISLLEKPGECLPIAKAAELRIQKYNQLQNDIETLGNVQLQVRGIAHIFCEYNLRYVDLLSGTYPVVALDKFYPRVSEVSDTALSLIFSNQAKMLTLLFTTSNEVDCNTIHAGNMIGSKFEIRDREEFRLIWEWFINE